jgi:hypothetical protein
MQDGIPGRDAAVVLDRDIPAGDFPIRRDTIAGRDRPLADGVGFRAGFFNPVALDMVVAFRDENGAVGDVPLLRISLPAVKTTWPSA